MGASLKGVPTIVGSVIGPQIFGNFHSTLRVVIQPSVHNGTVTATLRQSLYVFIYIYISILYKYTYKYTYIYMYVYIYIYMGPPCMGPSLGFLDPKISKYPYSECRDPKARI